MDTPQRIGTAIDFAIPAIVGGGLIQYFSGSWTAVAVFEIILLVVLIAIVSPKKSQ